VREKIIKFEIRIPRLNFRIVGENIIESLAYNSKSITSVLLIPIFLYTGTVRTSEETR
jgi:hypothetical protein